jgi:hypothetical protein
MSKRLILGAAVGIVLAAGILFGRAGSAGHVAGAVAAPRPNDDRVLAQLLAGLGGNDTSRYVAVLERRVARHRDGTTLLLLGLAYQQRARETGDPRYFTLSGDALAAARVHPAGEELADAGLASLAVSRHRFGAALPLARAALRMNPDDATALGALGDAFSTSGSTTRRSSPTTEWRSSRRALPRTAVSHTLASCWGGRTAPPTSSAWRSRCACLSASTAQRRSSSSGTSSSTPATWTRRLAPTGTR